MGLGGVGFGHVGRRPSSSLPPPPPCPIASPQNDSPDSLRPSLSSLSQPSSFSPSPLSTRCLTQLVHPVPPPPDSTCVPLPPASRLTRTGKTAISPVPCLCLPECVRALLPVAHRTAKTWNRSDPPPGGGGATVGDGEVECGEGETQNKICFSLA